MIESIAREIEIRKSELLQTPATLYFGGGTPSVCTITEINFIANKVKEIFGVKTFEEFTIELNPDDLNPAYLEGLKSVGVNRLSVGVQSFVDEQLRFMNRRHSAKQAIDCIKTAQQIGFKNISIDLIYGLPQLTIEQWRENINLFLELDVPHLSAYHLGIEKDTVFYEWLQQGKLIPAGEEQSEKQYNLLEELTSKAGFEHYEISNFAKNKKYSKHNSAYWQAVPYLGFGPSAHSYNGKNIRRWNIADNEKYIEAINSNQTFWTSEKLRNNEQYNDYIITSLRTIWGADLKFLQQNFAEKIYNHFNKSAEKFLSTGLLLCENGKIKIPPKHFLLSDGIMRELMLV